MGSGIVQAPYGGIVIIGGFFVCCEAMAPIATSIVE